MELKFSIIIPTMQKNIGILDLLLKELNEDESVGEIILIDNSLKGYSCDYEKVKVFIPNENLYVNPSWNFGIKQAKYNYFGILNDDILIPKNLPTEVLKTLIDNPKIGLVGIESSTVINDEDRDFSGYPSPIDKIILNNFRYTYENQNNFWGVAIWGSKANYYEIPEELLIYCGDDYLLKLNYDNCKTCYAISNITIKHCHSLTSSLPEYEQIKQNDLLKYAEIDLRYKKCFLDIEPKRTFIQNIFSITNSRDKRYKIVTIAGLKLKFKKNKNAVICQNKFKGLKRRGEFK